MMFFVLQATKVQVMAFFVNEKVSSKLLLVFARDNAWNTWLEVFNAWEAWEVIGDDGKEPHLIKRPPIFNITKTDLVPTLELQDIDLAGEVIASCIYMKSNSRTKDKLTLQD